MKKLTTIVVIVGILTVSTGLIVGVLFLSSHFLSSNSGDKEAGIVSCRTKGVVHVVKVINNQAVPSHVDGKLCDVMIITNTDSVVRLMAFGEHEDHQPYDGVTEKVLNKNQNLTVVLNQKGTYQFHDHLGDVAKGNFTVN